MAQTPTPLRRLCSEQREHGQPTFLTELLPRSRPMISRRLAKEVVEDAFADIALPGVDDDVDMNLTYGPAIPLIRPRILQIPDPPFHCLERSVALIYVERYVRNTGYRNELRIIL